MTYTQAVKTHIRKHLELLPYQQKALDFLLDESQIGPYAEPRNPSKALFIDMGLGKTVVVLSALKQLLTEDPDTKKVLVIGPKRVVEHTWPDEIGKWLDFRHFRYTVITGDQQARVTELMKQDVHIHFIGRDNIQWLTDYCINVLGGSRYWPWDTVVIDEMSSFKNSQSKRWRALKKVRPYIKRVIGMTGTPVPNGYMDLWAQVSLLDSGLRLGRGISQFRRVYFDQNPFSTFPDYKLREGAQQLIANKIKDICLSMAAEDYLDLPAINYIEVPSKPHKQIYSQYEDFKRSMVLKLQGGSSTALIEKSITAANAGVLCGKLLQFCGGNVYDEDRKVNYVHSTKDAALDQIVEEAQEQKQNLLIYYAYAHEKVKLLKQYPQARELTAHGVIEAWQKGDVPIAIAHPASTGHGLNLQSGGRTIVWYNVTYDLELWLQANKRLHRMGQEKPVTVYALTIHNMVDSHIFNTVLRDKERLQKVLTSELGVYAGCCNMDEKR